MNKEERIRKIIDEYWEGNTFDLSTVRCIARDAYDAGVTAAKKVYGNNDNPYNIDYKRQTKIDFDD